MVNPSPKLGLPRAFRYALLDFNEYFSPVLSFVHIERAYICHVMCQLRML